MRTGSMASGCPVVGTGDKIAIGVVENKPGFGQSPKNNGNGTPGQSTSTGSMMGVPDLLMGFVAVVAIMMAW
jgi:hypothetical protein